MYVYWRKREENACTQRCYRDMYGVYLTIIRPYSKSSDYNHMTVV